MLKIDFETIKSDLKDIVEKNSFENYHFYLRTYQEEIDKISKNYEDPIFDEFFDSLLMYLIENKSFDILMEIVDNTKEMMNVDIYPETHFLNLCIKNKLPIELRNKIIEHKFFYYENHKNPEMLDDVEENSEENRLLCLKLYDFLHQIDNDLSVCDKPLTIFTLGTPENKRLIELLDNEHLDLSEIKVNKYSSNLFLKSPMFLSFSNIDIQNVYENVIIPIIKRQDKVKRIQMISALISDVQILSEKIKLNSDSTLPESDIIKLNRSCDDFMSNLLNKFEEDFISDIVPNDMLNEEKNMFKIKCISEFRTLIGDGRHGDVNQLINLNVSEILKTNDQDIFLKKLKKIEMLLSFIIFEYGNFIITEENSLKNLNTISKPRYEHEKIDLFYSIDEYFPIDYSKLIIKNFFESLFENEQDKMNIGVICFNDYFLKILKSESLNLVFEEDRTLPFKLFSVLMKNFNPVNYDYSNSRHIELIDYLIFKYDIFHQENEDLFKNFIENANKIIFATKNPEYDILLSKLFYDKGYNFDYFFNNKDNFNDVYLLHHILSQNKDSNSKIILNYLISNIDLNERFNRCKDVSEMKELSIEEIDKEIFRNIIPLKLILNNIETLEGSKMLLISDKNKSKINYLIEKLISENILVDMLNGNDFSINIEKNKNIASDKLKKFNHIMLNNKTKTKIQKISLRKL